MARQYMIANGVDPTTAAVLPVTTGSSSTAKTLLQVQNTTVPFLVYEWGISFTGIPSAITCELIDTGSVAATVTAHVIAGIQPYGPDQTASTVALGTAATGYTASAEGTTTVTRIGDVQIVTANQYVKQMPLGREFYVPKSNILRIRVTAAAAVTATCYVIIEET